VTTHDLSATIRNPIPVAGPSITQLEIDYVADAAANAWYGDAFKYHRAFESTFANYVGRTHALSLPGCTAGIHLSLMALEIQAGDEVIVPDATWVASAVPITYVGATPVFVDIRPDTWCLSIEAVEQAITPRTKAIIAVDLYGNMVDYAQLEALCESHGIALIEDAAEAIGSSINGKRAGAFGATSVFSFHGTKTLTTGEGGMVLTDDDALFERLQILGDHGRTPGDRSYFHGELAWKYKMSNVQAALGLAQTERVEELVAIKRQAMRWYAERLGHRDDISLNIEPDGTRNMCWMNTVIVDKALGLDKHALMKQLGDCGVTTRPFFYPLSSLPAFAGHPAAVDGERRNPVAYDVSSRGINLPSALNLTEAEIDYVCTSLSGILDSHH
jgi:perosamine synthetase